MFKFNLIVGTKTRKTDVPEFTLLANSITRKDNGKELATVGRFRLNEPATELLKLEPGDYIAFSNDEDLYFIGKVPADLIDRFPAGSKLACSNPKATGYGLILTGTQAKFHDLAGGDFENHKVFTISSEVAGTYEDNGVEVDFYQITFDRTEEKAVRTQRTDGLDEEIED